MTLTREQIAGLRDDLRRQPYNTVAVQRDDLAALLDIAEAVANAPQVEVTACNQIPGASDFDHGDMLSAILPLKPGTYVAVLPLAGEVGNG